MDDARGPDGETVLETERLLLRRWLVSDAAVQRQLWEERDLRVPAERRISVDGHPSIEEFEDRIRLHEGNDHLGPLILVHKEHGTVIGYCGLIADAQGQIDEPELAYELLREHWGNGFATEASLAVVEWAHSRGYTRLWATIREWNTASRHVISKVGFVETARTEPDAEHGDSLVYRRDLDQAAG